MNPVLNVNLYKADGFVKICQVRAAYNPNNWEYFQINEFVMYDSHNSWIYFIVVNDEIVKIGETGNPLGIQTYWGEPLSGSKSRLGRYMNGDGTDARIRKELEKAVLCKQTKVEFWARKCEKVVVKSTIAGCVIETETTFHKDMETQYLDYVHKHMRSYPRLNKARK